jgi:hypothetical protein
MRCLGERKSFKDNLFACRDALNEYKAKSSDGAVFLQELGV